MPAEHTTHGAGDALPRRMLILAGPRDAVHRDVAELLSEVTHHVAAADVLWVGSDAPVPYSALDAASLRQRLGSECRVLVFDLYSGFHPDAFAAAVGTLRGGGDCVLLAPPMREWASFDDPDRRRFSAYPCDGSTLSGLFLDRLRHLWSRSDGVHIATSITDETLRIAPPPDSGAITPSTAQEEIVDAVCRVAQGHARRPLVLTADRGRGKSTVLGIAAARLLQRGLKRVSVVAPSRAAAATLFRHARLAAGSDDDDGVVPRLDIGAGQLCFCLPSEWGADDRSDASLLLVDEAAAIPLAMLEAMLRAANRVVFASTVHGYEGSGRGFELRFRHTLDRHARQWRAMRLETPVRWVADDPLELAVNRGLLLDAELVDVGDGGDERVALLSAERLAADEPLLRAVFALLVNAHYQTRPSDLRQLLDNPDVRLWIAQRGTAIVGVLLGLREGGFDEHMAAAVSSGERRPRGHLLTQSLAVHGGLDGILSMRILRVQRIAVHPACRRQGTGSRLLATATSWAQSQGVDMLGCAYGVEPSLLAFWHATGFTAARLGVRVDPASATHSLFMLRGLGEPGRQLAHEALAAFQHDLPWLLGGAGSDVDGRVALALLVGRDMSDLPLSATEGSALARLAGGARQVDTATALSWKALLHCAAAADPDAALAPLLAWRLQHWPVARVCSEYGLAGRHALDTRLRDALRALVAKL